MKYLWVGYTDNKLHFFTEDIKPYNQYAYLFKTKREAKLIFEDVRKVVIKEIKSVKE